MSSFVIIVPCYNEAKRLACSTFIAFAQAHSDVEFIFVNDGSTDETEKLLLNIQQAVPHTMIVNLSKNQGKGEAVRQGAITALEKKFNYVGYLDADLSTSLDEFYQLLQKADYNNTDITLAARIQKADTIIERSFMRHMIGRTIATIIDKKINLGIYDTQCGAKIFSSGILFDIIHQPFYTRWFFDVELLCRARHKYKNYKVEEIPLRTWRNVKNSKIGVLSFPTIFKELVILLT